MFGKPSGRRWRRRCGRPSRRQAPPAARRSRPLGAPHPRPARGGTRPPVPSALPRWRGRHSPTEVSCFLDLVSPREIGAAAGDEQQRGTTDADEVVGLELGGAQDRVPAEAHQVRLAAVLQVEAALLLVVGDERMLLARYAVVAKAKPY